MPGRTKKKILFECELDTLDKLEKIMNDALRESLAKERQAAIAVNPFMSMMYKNMSFNVWSEIYSKLNNKVFTQLRQKSADETAAHWVIT